MNEHEIDELMGYCVKCGMARFQIANTGQVDCLAGDNVIAISHVVRMRRLSAFVGDVQVYLGPEITYTP